MDRGFQPVSRGGQAGQSIGWGRRVSGGIEEGAGGGRRRDPVARERLCHERVPAHRNRERGRDVGGSRFKPGSRCNSAHSLTKKADSHPELVEG